MPSLFLVNIYRILYSLRYVILLFFTSTRIGCALKNCPFARQDANYNSGGFSNVNLSLSLSPRFSLSVHSVTLLFSLVCKYVSSSFFLIGICNRISLVGDCYNGDKNPLTLEKPCDGHFNRSMNIKSIIPLLHPFGLVSIMPLSSR